MYENNVQFDGDLNDFSYYKGDKNPVPVQFLIDKGFAKNKKQAYIILTVISVAILILSVILFGRGGVDYTPAPPQPGEEIPL